VYELTLYIHSELTLKDDPIPSDVHIPRRKPEGRKDRKEGRMFQIWSAHNHPDI